MSKKVCPKCGTFFKVSKWKRHKSNNGLYYYCPNRKCHTKLHWNDLLNYEKKIN